MEYKTLVVSGAAISGKTTVIEEVSKTLKKQGRVVFTLSETATELLKAGFDPSSNRLLFQKSLFELQLTREQNYREHISSLENETAKNALLILDRALLDGETYISESDFSSIVSQQGLTKKKILESYDAVIQLQYASCFYGKKGNEFRIETSITECIMQDRLLKLAYASHACYRYVASESDIKKKIKNTLAVIEELHL